MNKTLIFYTLFIAFFALVSAESNIDIFTYASSNSSSNDTELLAHCMNEKVGMNILNACAKMNYEHWNNTMDAKGNVKPTDTEEYCCGTWFTMICGYGFIEIYCNSQELNAFEKAIYSVIEYISVHECKSYQYIEEPPGACRRDA